MHYLALLCYYMCVSLRECIQKSSNRFSCSTIDNIRHMDWKRPLNYFPILVTVHQYIQKFADWLLAFCCLFEGQFKGVDIPFTLFIVLCCVLNKNTACLWTLGEILFATHDNGRYAPANYSAAALLANFSSPHLHNQRNV